MAINKQSDGWQPWYPVQTTRGNFDVPFGHFPPSYLPATTFWGDAIALHGQLPTPWSSLKSAEQAFAEAGGNTATIEGLLGGIAAAGAINAQENTISFGIGQQYDPPTVGFCVGNTYKENTYFKYEITRPNAGHTELIYNAGIDVCQRSRLNRAYIYHGYITSVNIDSKKNTITIGIDYNGTIDPSITFSIQNFKLTVIKKTNSRSSYQISQINRDFSMVLPLSGSATSIHNPAVGDFYEITKPLCIVDPYLMSGAFFGTEATVNSGNNSGKNMYVTDHNKPYSQCYFTGAYVYVSKMDGGPASISPDTPFLTYNSYEWLWVPLAHYAGSEIYGNSKDRYYENIFAADYGGGSVTLTTVTATPSLPSQKIIPIFDIGSGSDINNWIKAKNQTYIRLELAQGGQAFRQNFHVPILKKCFIFQNGMYFAILGQPEGNVVDVSLLGVDGATQLNINASYSIINQYCWMISEHLSYNSSGTSNYFIQGSITSTAVELGGASNVIMSCLGLSTGTTLPTSKLVNGSFWDRFTINYSPTSFEPTKVWRKYTNWKLVTSNGTSYNIIPGSVKYTGGGTALQPFSVYFEINGKLNNDTEGYVVFDTPYSRIGNFNPQLTSATIEQAATDINSVFLDVNMEYLSSQMKINIPTNTIVGVCGGVWWGVEGAGGTDHIPSSNGLDLWVSTAQGFGGIDAFRNTLTNKEYIFYTDPLTNKLSIRKGSQNFRDYPEKIEITVGKPSLTETTQFFPIALNQNQDRVKTINLPLPKGTDPAPTTTPPIPNKISAGGTDVFGSVAVSLQTKTQTNYFGFISTGKGQIDFQALRRLGYKAGTVPNTFFQYDGEFVSPIYIWKKLSNNGSGNSCSVNMGISTAEQNIYATNYISSATAQISIEYVNNEQTLEGMHNYNAYYLPDGTTLVIYSMAIPPFTINSTTINPANQWDTSSAIFIVGSYGEEAFWGCPFITPKTIEDQDKYLKPTMLLYSCELESSYYDTNSQELGIITKCYYNNDPTKIFYGLYLIPIYAIPIDNMPICKVTSGTTVSDFLYRPSQLEDKAWTTNNSFVTKEDYLQPTGELGFVSDTKNNNSDRFFKIIGDVATGSDINPAMSLTFSLSQVLYNGMVVLFYSDDQGVKVLSYNGLKWKKSLINLALNGTSPYFLRDALFYIDSEGVKVKINMITNVYDATQINENEGKDPTEIESVQEAINKNTTILITPTVTTLRRLAAFISVDGSYNVTFYDDSGILNCFTSDNLSNWQPNYNF